MSNIEQLLMDKKMKRTKARVLILKTLAKGLPLSAGEVFEAVRVKDTQLSLSTLATYALRDRFGVLNSCDVRSALQTLTLQLQMPKIFCSPSIFVI